MLRAAPGVWHEIPDAPKTSTSDIRRGVTTAFSPPGAFDATRGRGALFIRYVGEPSVAWRDPVTLAYAINPATGEAYTFDDLPRDPDYCDVKQPD